jgi:eukaryotic-like serine/threonine-protein kinase
VTRRLPRGPAATLRKLAAWRAASEDLVGRRFGDYRAVKRLDGGGFGAIYLAEQVNTPNLQAVVKVMHRHLCRNGVLVSRFYQEARAAAAIRHDGIIRMFDARQTDDGIPYLLMEFLDGETLRTRIERERSLALGSVLEIGALTAEALVAVHQHGIVHRDLKPANLVIVRDPRRPGHERVKLLDFGIAKLGSTSKAPADLTLTGQPMGTPQYMSPEQWLEPRDVDHRADIYALGAILHEMLTGQPPFSAENVFQLRASHLQTPPPSARALRPDLPPGLDPLVQRCLAKNPGHRFQSAAEVASELRATLGRPQ